MPFALRSSALIRRPRAGRLVSAATALSVLSAVAVAGCSSHTGTSAGGPTASAGGKTANAAPAAAAKIGADQTITIGPTPLSTSWTAASAGLSFEAYYLTLPGFTSGNLAAYLDTLSPSSVLRIGGNTADETFWTSTGESAPSWSMGTITPADLNALAGLAKASGWKVILGVNLKQYDPARAADEAKHAQRALGSSLEAIEIGNEPDLYPTYKSDPAKYPGDFAAYASAIRQAAPGVPLEGDDTAAKPSSHFQKAFVAEQKQLPSPDITELTNHYYPLAATTCGGSPTIAQMLGTGTRDAERTEADEAVAEARQLGLPAVIDEGNSVVCEGQEGVSNIYASALWAIDAQLDVAREGVSGFYMHGTVEQCGTPKPLYMYYTPLCAPTAADAAKGQLAAQPEFYGLAALHDVGTGRFLNLTNPASADVRAYAIEHSDGTMTVVLDDVDDPSAKGATTLQLDLGSSYSSANRVSLTASGGLTATSGVTLGGQTVQSDGALAAPAPTSVNVSGDTATVTVPAGSAQILTFKH